MRVDREIRRGGVGGNRFRALGADRGRRGRKRGLRRVVRGGKRPRGRNGIGDRGRGSGGRMRRRGVLGHHRARVDRQRRLHLGVGARGDIERAGRSGGVDDLRRLERGLGLALAPASAQFGGIHVHFRANGRFRGPTDDVRHRRQEFRNCRRVIGPDQHLAAVGRPRRIEDDRRLRIVSAGQNRVFGLRLRARNRLRLFRLGSGDGGDVGRWPVPGDFDLWKRDVGLRQGHAAERNADGQQNYVPDERPGDPAAWRPAGRDTEPEERSGRVDVARCARAGECGAKAFDEICTARLPAHFQPGRFECTWSGAGARGHGESRNYTAVRGRGWKRPCHGANWLQPCRPHFALRHPVRLVGENDGGVKPASTRASLCFAKLLERYSD
jgi:hypothetical protein